MAGIKRINVQNANTVSRSGAGQRQDLSGRYQIDQFSSNPIDRARSPAVQARLWAQFYYKEWAARKIINIPVEDMLRNRWEYPNIDDEQCKALDRANAIMGLEKKLRQAKRIERLLGGSAIFMGIADGSDDDPSKPVNLQAIGEGDLKFINLIPRTRLSAYSIQQNPLESDFGKPDVYSIDGYQVHNSRLMIFDGDPLTDNESYDLSLVSGSRDGFGVSVLAPIFDDIMRSVGTRQAAYHLIQRASVLLINNGNLQTMASTKDGKAALEKLNDIADQMSMFQAAMIDGKKVNIDQWSASFGSVPELLMSFLQILSAASDIPATRFLGQAPGGLNATGESDLENYYNMIDSKRSGPLREQLEKFFSVQMRSVFGKNFKQEMVELEFPPLWNMSETELATVRTSDTTNVSTLVNSGIITANEAIEELKERDALLIDAEPDGDLGVDLPEDENVDIEAELINLRGLEDANNNLG